MKKAAAKKTTEKTNPAKGKLAKLSLEDQIDSLARIVVSGFDRIDKRFELVDKRFEQIDKRFDHVNQRFESVDSQLISIHQQLHDHTKRLERIELQQVNTREALDNSVPRSEFKALVRRVETLEKK